MPEAKIPPDHEWVGATTVDLSDQQVRQANLRGSIRVTDTRVDVLEAYCKNCRRPYDDVADEQCIAATTREHLHGGPIGVRAKRAHRYHDCWQEGCDTAEIVAARQARRTS